MANKYLKGTIIKLNEDSDKLYLVLGSEEINDESFLLIMPVDNIEEIVIDITKAFVIKVSEDEEITMVTDVKMAEIVIKKIMEKEQTMEENLKNKGNLK